MLYSEDPYYKIFVINAVYAFVLCNVAYIYRDLCSTCGEL